jgi:allantoinase
MRKIFVNARLPDAGNETRLVDLVVASGRITSVGATGAPTAGDEVLDLGGALVLPGVIDTHVHFDEPGFTHRENFATGTKAAAAGGITTIVDMPCTTLPAVTTATALENKLDVVSRKAHVDFMLWGGVSDNALADPKWRAHLADIVERGVASIKIYMLSGMETFRDLSPDQIRDVLRETAKLGIPVGVHAENRDLVHALTDRLMAEGRDAPLDYAASRPTDAELSAVTTMRDLCRETGARVHIVHLATGSAVEIVRDAKRDGLPFTAETCPHYLAFTEDDLDRQGSLLKTAPVVKGAADRDALWDGVAGGDIEWVATDHAAGQWPDEKTTGSIWTDYGGVPGVELMLPYLYSEGVRTGRITLERLVEITATAPARFLGVTGRKGCLAEGCDADFVVFDDQEEWTVRAVDLHNLNRYTPLEGRTLTGRVRSVYLRGERVYLRRDDRTESFAPPGTGRWLERPSRVGDRG